MSDTKFKGIHWAGNLYQKFEAMCIEVEEVMYQDTAKYLENQVQTVSTSVKKFYSEVMQDILPPSYIDPVKVAAADLPLNPYSDAEFNKKTKKSITEDIEECKPRETEVCKKMAVVNAERATSFAQCDGVFHHLPMSECDSHMNRCSELERREHGGLHRRPTLISKGSGNRDQQSKMSGLDTPVSSFHKMKNELPSAIVEVYETGEAKDSSHLMDEDFVRCSASLDSLNLDSSSLPETVNRKQADSMSTTISHELSSESIDSVTKGAAPDSKEELIVSFEGRPYISDMDVVGNHIEPELEFVERFAEPKFEETCVLVEGCGIHVVSSKDGKHKSYKKKIREALSSKMRSRRKKEYEKLSAHYSIQAPELESMEKPMPSCYKDSNSKKLEAKYMPESEWEIL